MTSRGEAEEGSEGCADGPNPFGADPAPCPHAHEASPTQMAAIRSDADILAACRGIRAISLSAR